MDLHYTRQYGIIRLVKALDSTVLINLLDRGDRGEHSNLLKEALLPLRRLFGSRASLQDYRRILLDMAVETMDMVVRKEDQSGWLERAVVHNLDAVESTITTGQPLHFNGPLGLSMTEEWFRSGDGRTAPQILKRNLGMLTERLGGLRAIVSALRYEARAVADNPPVNEVLLSYMDQALPLVLCYHNDVLTIDRDVIRQSLERGSGTAIIAVKLEGYGTWAAASAEELSRFGYRWAAVFEVTWAGVRPLNPDLRATA